LWQTMPFVQAYRPIALQMRLPRPRKRPSTARSPATAIASARSRMSTLLKASFCKLETRPPTLTARLCLQRPRWRSRPALWAVFQDRNLAVRPEGLNKQFDTAMVRVSRLTHCGHHGSIWRRKITNWRRLCLCCLRSVLRVADAAQRLWTRPPPIK
jgi:hypothetical protein